MNDEGLTLDPDRCVLILQDLQNDVMIDGGAFADSGAPQHAKDQNVVENVKSLAETCRSKGVPVIHVHYIVVVEASHHVGNRINTSDVAEELVS